MQKLICVGLAGLLGTLGRYFVTGCSLAKLI